MDAKYYPLVGGVLVLVVAGFVMWQQSIVKKNLINSQAPGTTSENLNINLNNNMENQPPSNEELGVEILKQGTGQGAKNGDKVSVRYTGYFKGGEVFDSNIASADPFVFTLGAGDVINGWDQGVLGMKVGEKRKLSIPSDLAYGATGAKNPSTGEYVILPNTPLVFDVEMIKIGQ